MSKIDTSELVDIFKEESTKKAKREIKKLKKKEKQLEKQENLEFEKLAKKHEEKEKREKIQAERREKNNIEEKEIVVKENEVSIFSFLYDTLFGFFLILLCLCSLGFITLSLMKSQNLKTLIQVGLIGLFACSYVISMTSKKNGIKKFTAILSSISICLYMIFIFYIS